MIDASAATPSETDTRSESPSDWDAWFDATAPALVLFARQWTGAHADAEDVVQEAIVRFWNTGRHQAEDPRAYLFASVKRAALDLQRGRLRRQRREARVRLEAASAPAAGGGGGLFESTLEHDEWRAAVVAALDRLPVNQREVLVMKVWGELTFPQIGSVLKVAPNTAASRYRYALENLRRQIAEEEVR
jgi:RNA polymerase sigma-70 factor, ECF subfamily